jgi:hypothetical protein
LVISAVLHGAAVAPRGWDKLTWVDDEGRPLIESHAPVELCDAAGLELRVCPYNDSRHHHERPMNVTALQQVRHHWQPTKDIYLGLRSLLRRGADGGPLSNDELWRLSYLAFAVPPYLALSARETGPVLPAWAAALFKTGLGLTPLTVMMFESRLAGDSQAIADASEVLAVADAQGTLIGSRHVCAGPPRMIHEILDFVIDPPDGAPVRATGTVLDDPEGLRTFALELLNACTAVYLFFLARQYLAGDLFRAIAGTPHVDRVRDQLAELQAVGVDPNVFPYIDVLDEVTDNDRRDLMRVIAGLIEPVDSEALRSLASEYGERWLEPDVGGSTFERLLHTSRRFETGFVEMITEAEQSIRAGLGLPPFDGPLGPAAVDRLYPSNPRRLLEQVV